MHDTLMKPTSQMAVWGGFCRLISVGTSLIWANTHVLERLAGTFEPRSKLGTIEFGHRSVVLF